MKHLTIFEDTETFEEEKDNLDLPNVSYIEDDGGVEYLAAPRGSGPNIEIINYFDDLKDIGGSFFFAFMPGVTFDGVEKHGLLLYYDDEQVVLPYRHSYAPEEYTVYKAADNKGNYEPAWSVTSLGWSSLCQDINLVLQPYGEGEIPYAGTSEMEIENFSVMLVPEE